ncbi:hypothetical protein ACFQ3N_15805 [Virgibacillus byunsanensis]|uniref:Uncharacterized protein n=1 Tax=Virgibacillus byunsanensis TaxID=570945 RepID=A0ABW3LN83_9BACI
MAFTIIIILTWLIGTIFYFTPKTLSFLQNSIVFMLLAIISRNNMTIVTMELESIQTSQQPIIYMFFLIQREVIIPILTLIFINIYYKIETISKKIILFLIIYLGMFSLNYLSITLDVVTYLKWNYFYDLLHDTIYLLVGLWLSKIILLIEKKESQHNGSGHLL